MDRDTAGMLPVSERPSKFSLNRRLVSDSRKNSFLAVGLLLAAMREIGFTF
jgi:hypothetical protein